MNEVLQNIDSLNCRIATLEDWLEASKAREKALEETLTDHKKVIEVWRKDLDRYSSEMATLTTQIDGLSLVNRSQEETISIQYKELNKTRGLKEQIELFELYEIILGPNRNEETEIEALRRNLNDLQKRYVAAIEEIDRLKQQANQLVKAVEEERR